MSRSGVWVLRVGGIAILVGVVVYLLIVGPERANWLNSVLGTVIALAALVAPYLWPTPARGKDTAEPERDRQSIENANVHGRLVQDNLNDSASPARSSQSIRNVRVGGDLRQSSSKRQSKRD